VELSEGDSPARISTGAFSSLQSKARILTFLKVEIIKEPEIRKGTV
jgi:hypothetical protein